MDRRSLNESPVRLAKLSAAIFIVALFVRLIPNGLYVTPDEPIWVMRSVRFLQAVEAGDWGSVPQTGHPGITTMVLGSLAVKTMTWLQPEVAAQHQDWISKMAWLAPENAEAFEHLAYFLPAGRVFVAVITSACLVWAYQLGQRRFETRTARWMALFLALDPFFAGHSGLLHTDALQATFAMLAMLLLFQPAEGVSILQPHRRHMRPSISLVLAALCLALSGLTKTLGLLVAPGLALAMLLWGTGTWQQRSVRVAMLAALTAIFLLVLYPPFWVAPRAALNSLIGAVTYHEGIGLRLVFFLGKMHTDPGLAFYPFVLLFRMTPTVLLGLVYALFGIRRRHQDAYRLLRWGGLTAITYLIALMTATKKFDRYVLTVIPLLTPAAAAAWSQAKGAWRRAALGFLLLPWALVAVIPLHYASPLFGGPWGAQEVIPLGWGEASGLAGRKLNQLLPAPETATLLTENVAGTAASFSGETWPWTKTTVGCTDAIIGSESDVSAGYAIAEQLRVAGRDLATIYTLSPTETSSLPWLAAGALPGLSNLMVPEADAPGELAAWLNAHLDAGTSFLWVHAPLCYPLAEAQIKTLFAAGEAAGHLVCEPASPVSHFEAEQCRRLTALRASEPYVARFAGAVDLVSVAWAEPAQAPNPLTVELRWLPHTELGELDIYLALLTGDGAQEIIWADGGQRVVNNWGWPAPDWQVDAVTDGKAYITLPLDLPPGTYTLTMSLANSDGWLGLTYHDGAFGGMQLVLGTVSIAAPPYPAAQLNQMSATEANWPGVRVIGVQPPEAQLLAGQALQFSLGLERKAGPAAETLAWELVCGAERRQEGVLPWVPTAPAEWPIGHRYQMKYAPPLRPDLPEGSCTVSVWPVVEDTRSVDPVSTDKSQMSGPEVDRVIIGEISVQQRSRSFTLPRLPGISLAIIAGDFGELVGADLVSPECKPGEDVNVTLYWHALGPAEDNYTVFVHLVDSEDKVWAQSDTWPNSGSAPTTTWSKDEIIIDPHALRMPSAIPAGDYRLYVGMYDAKRGTRQTLFTEESRLAGNRAYLSSVDIRP